MFVNGNAFSLLITNSSISTNLFFLTERVDAASIKQHIRVTFSFSDFDLLLLCINNVYISLAILHNELYIGNKGNLFY